MKDRLLVGALRAAYRDLLARDRHPIAALFLEVPPSEVDINVHPAKTEVRFRDPAAVRGLIVGGLRAALDEAGHRSAAREQFARAGGSGADASTAMPSEAELRAGRCSRPVATASAPAFAGATDSGFDFADLPPAARAEAATAPVPTLSRSASRAGRSRRPISSPRPRTGW